MTLLLKYATATHIYIPIVKRAVVDFAVGADWTPAAGDVKISIDGGAAANVTNLPTAIAMGNTAIWDFSMTSGEMTGAKILITVADAATKAVEDQAILVETFGNASAALVFDLSTASQVVASVTGAVGSVTGNVGGNVTGTVGSVVGAVGSVTGAVGSVTGAVGSVTGAVGSVTGNVGGNVVGTVASVVGAVGSVTGAVASVTGNVGGNVTGTVGSVVGAVGSVASGGIAAASIASGAITNAKFAAGAIDATAIADGAIDAATFAAGAINAAAIATDAITAAKIAADAIGASELAADAATEIATAVWAATMTELSAVPGVTASVLSALELVFLATRNKITQTATTTLLRNDADAATIGTSTVSDDGTTFVRGKFV